MSECAFCAVWVPAATCIHNDARGVPSVSLPLRPRARLVSGQRESPVNHLLTKRQVTSVRVPGRIAGGSARPTLTFRQAPSLHSARNGLAQLRAPQQNDARFTGAMSTPLHNTQASRTLRRSPSMPRRSVNDRSSDRAPRLEREATHVSLDIILRTVDTRSDDLCPRQPSRGAVWRCRISSNGESRDLVRQLAGLDPSSFGPDLTRRAFGPSGPLYETSLVKPGASGEPTDLPPRLTTCGRSGAPSHHAVRRSAGRRGGSPYQWPTPHAEHSARSEGSDS